MKVTGIILRRRSMRNRMGSTSPRVVYAAAVVASIVVLCGGGQAATTSPLDTTSETTQSMAPPEAIEREVARVRAATAPFKSLDRAVAAGYRRDGGACVDNPPHGAMGYHHRNDALLDDRVEVERPEMLVYERLPNGGYRLNGVEYIVPFSARPETSEPPTAMGQALKPFPSLRIWYLHVWVWTENPSGLFADWNPRVKCDRRPGAL